MRRAAVTSVVVALSLPACGGSGVPFGVRLFQRPAASQDRLPAGAAATDPFLSEGRSRFVARVGNARYWAVRYADQVCLVDVPVRPRHRIGPGEACEPLADLRRAPLVSVVPTGRDVEVLGIIRDGYDRVMVDGMGEPVPVRDNVIRATGPGVRLHLTASGPHVPDVSL